MLTQLLPKNIGPRQSHELKRIVAGAVGLTNDQRRAEHGFRSFNVQQWRTRVLASQP
jgi:hypothetical protein